MARFVWRPRQFLYFPVRRSELITVDDLSSVNTVSRPKKIGITGPVSICARIYISLETAGFQVTCERPLCLGIYVTNSRFPCRYMLRKSKASVEIAARARSACKGSDSKIQLVFHKQAKKKADELAEISFEEKRCGRA